MRRLGTHLLYISVGVVIVASAILAGFLAAFMLEELTGEFQPVWMVVGIVGGLSYFIGGMVADSTGWVRA